MIPISNPDIDRAAIDHVVEVLESGQLAEGKQVHEFENRFAVAVGSKHAIATTNGTTALHVALLAAGVKPGDYVITTSFSFVATGNAILYCGATPIFVDIDSATHNISPSSISGAIKKYPTARFLLIVHLFGNPCHMDDVRDIVDQYGLTLIEDCAQSHLATWDGQSTGTFGSTAAFSFYPTKNMTTGEGGLVTTNDDDIAAKARLLVHHGAAARYEHLMLGYNYRMTNIAAAIGLAQIDRLSLFTSKRRQNARYYDTVLSGRDEVKRPNAHYKAGHVYHQYTIELADRPRFIQHLADNGVGYGIYYPHLIPDYEYMKKASVCLDLNNAVAARDSVVSIPVHPGLSQEQLEFVCHAIEDYLAR